MEKEVRLHQLLNLGRSQMDGQEGVNDLHGWTSEHE